ncbi:hypothetical protein MBH78_17245 [Oceanimonas sp. NS1]|nr:hypothetical protein [Oceanimonas sp. NS1]
MVVAGLPITTLLVSTLAKGVFRLVPITAGIAVGYGMALAMGVVDFSPVRDAPWFSCPTLWRRSGTGRRCCS